MLNLDLNLTFFIFLWVCTVYICMSNANKKFFRAFSLRAIIDLLFYNQCRKLSRFAIGFVLSLVPTSLFNSRTPPHSISFLMRMCTENSIFSPLRFLFYHLPNELNANKKLPYSDIKWEKHRPTNKIPYKCTYIYCFASHRLWLKRKLKSKWKKKQYTKKKNSPGYHSAAVDFERKLIFVIISYYWSLLSYNVYDTYSIVQPRRIKTNNRPRVMWPNVKIET